MFSKTSLFALAALATVVISGCGGGGSNTANVVNSPFEGSYHGLYTELGSNGLTGTLLLTIGSDGQIDGSLTGTFAMAATGVISGNTNISGLAAWTIAYQGVASSTDKGTLVLNSNGHLTGNLREYSGTTQVGTATIDLVRQ